MEKIAGKIGIKEMPDHDRPRERMAKFGPDVLSDEEQLAILLGSGSRKKNAIELASQVLHHREGRTWLLQASLDELTEIEGIGVSKASRILAGLALFKSLNETDKFYNISLNSPARVADYFRAKLSDLEKEHFCTILLDIKLRPLQAEIVSVGGLAQAPVHPREVFRTAIRRSAAGILLAHNHPSGNPEPSSEDIGLTNRLIEAGKIIGIQVHDHIIVAANKYISFREKGLI